jgi:hypothetical protein
MSSLGIGKINKLVMDDYADGSRPSHTFRLEIDIPIDEASDFRRLKDLLKTRRTRRVDERIVRFLLKMLPEVPDDGSKESRQYKAARRFIAAGFEQEDPGPV